MSNHLRKMPLLPGCKARLASYSKVLVLDWTRKGQTGPRQRPCEGSAQAENRDREDLVRVPQVSGKGWERVCPMSPQRRHLLSKRSLEKDLVKLPHCQSHDEKN